MIEFGRRTDVSSELAKHELSLSLSAVTVTDLGSRIVWMEGRFAAIERWIAAATVIFLHVDSLPYNSHSCAAGRSSAEALKAIGINSIIHLIISLKGRE